MSKIIELQLEQGTTWSRAFDVTVQGEPLNLAAYDIRMQIRPNYADFTEEIIIEATLANDRIRKDESIDNRFYITFSAEDTQGIRINRQAFFDIELEDSEGDVKRIAAGRVTLFREVTRND